MPKDVLEGYLRVSMQAHIPQDLAPKSLAALRKDRRDAFAIIRELSPEELPLFRDAVAQKGKQWISIIDTRPADFTQKLPRLPVRKSANVRPFPKPPTDEPCMADEDDRIITRQGIRYLPVSLAAERAQAPRTTLHSWLRTKKEFAGRPLDVYNSPTAHKVFLSEESVEKTGEPLY